MELFCPRCAASVSPNEKYCSECNRKYNLQLKPLPFKPGLSASKEHPWLVPSMLALAAVPILGLCYFLYEAVTTHSRSTDYVVKPHSTNSTVSTAGGKDDKKSGSRAKTPEEEAKDFVERLTPEGRATADRLIKKDDQLTQFQKANDISDRIAEAAIFEWVSKHGNNFDWDLEEVKAICLRNKRDGIPYNYLPASERRK